MDEKVLNVFLLLPYYFFNDFFSNFVVYHWLFPPRLASKNALREAIRLWLELRTSDHNEILTCDTQTLDDFREIKARSIWKPCSTTFVFCSPGLFERWPSCEKTRFTNLNAKASCSIQPSTFTQKPNPLSPSSWHMLHLFLSEETRRLTRLPSREDVDFIIDLEVRGHSTTSVAFLSHNKWSCSRQIREKECYHKCKREYLQAK